MNSEWTVRCSYWSKGQRKQANSRDPRPWPWETALTNVYQSASYLLQWGKERLDSYLA